MKEDEPIIINTMFNKGDKVMYGDMEAIIIDTHIEAGKEYASTYKIEIYTICFRRFWVHNKQISRLP